MIAAAPLLDIDVWVPILDGDDHARAMYETHYSSRKSMATRLARGAKLFIGPGNKFVLSTPCRRAVFAWRRAQYRSDMQRGVECALFRNTGAGIASDLIRAADVIAERRWPGERHFTFVDPARVRGNPPGNVFYRAGWRKCGETASGLHILERLP